MQGFLAAAVIAATSAASSATLAETIDGGRQRHNDYYYASYDTAFQPVCIDRNIRMKNADGTVTVKKVRVCR
ncbi:hypothetical protein [Pararhizobium gei]|uniref:hypothetical protein n=1 Tax=Pararhizobium gei TaxID=1395951 RepID=UPI0023DB1113|nr:hypothetical protein [Rhizobium gei]